MGQPNGFGYRSIAEEDVYKFSMILMKPVTTVVATEKTIANLTTDDVGKWIKIKGLQFIDSDLGKTYADGTATTNRTLKIVLEIKLFLELMEFFHCSTR